MALGQLDNSGVFEASEVLAKHDENYMPPEVQDALEKAHLDGKAKMENANSSDTDTSYGKGAGY